MSRENAVKKQTISQIVEAFIGHNIQIGTEETFDLEYQSIFSKEGERKAREVINRLLLKCSDLGFDLSRFAYFCVGGADGSEVETILNETEIIHAITLDTSDEGTVRARIKSENQKKVGKNLLVLQGDANLRLDDVLSYLNKLRESYNIDGLVVSAQAVLHELPSRSPNFNFPVFVGKCFSVFQNNAFYCREPILPERWPEFVEVKLPGVDGERLRILSCLIKEKLSMSCRPPEAVGYNFVNMDAILAVEVLHKLLRTGSVKHFKHELGERLTSIKTDEIQRMLEKDLGPGSVRVEPFITDGFMKAWRAYNVSARDPNNGTLLSMPNTHARIIGMRLSKRLASDAIPANNSTFQIATKNIDIEELNEEFAICRQDRVGKTRRRAIRSILSKVRQSGINDFESAKLVVRLWRELAFEAKTRKDIQNALTAAQEAHHQLMAWCSTSTQEDIANEILANLAIEFSRLAGPSVALNAIVAGLNKARKLLGQRINQYNASKGEAADKLASLLCLRAKCSRAFASLYLRRGQEARQNVDRAVKAKNFALNDAEKANSLLANSDNQLELALCLFATSATTHTADANRALSLLENCWTKEKHLIIGYELVKQYKFRHNDEEAIEIFVQIEKMDKSRRRFHSNMQDFSSAILGLHYDGADRQLVLGYALLGCEWYKEMMSYDRYNARDVIDYCYLKAICGVPFDEAAEPLKVLKPNSVETWNQILKIAQDATFGEVDLDDALLLGLEDPMIWSKIGTFYLEFDGDWKKAVEFYDRAISLDQRSPLFYLSKAEALAYHGKEYQLAKVALNSALSLKRRKWMWFKSQNVKDKIRNLKELINSHVGQIT